MKIYIYLNVLILLSITTLSAQKMGSFLDVRDGKVYKTVEIGNQVWMAQNLNFKVRGAWCYANNDDNCDKYGQIYTWTTIMNGEIKEKAKGICPDGWHIPSNNEWEALATEYKKSKDLAIGGISGFEMLYAGCRFSNGSFDFVNKVATFWTSSVDQYNEKFVFTRYAYQDKKAASMASYSTNKDYGQYLRCIKD